MRSYETIKVLPGNEDYDLFEAFPKKIYPKNSPRFIYGNDAVQKHLLGCYILKIDGEVVGRFAIYTNPNLHYDSHPACTIGSFECRTDQEVADQLLTSAVQIAKETRKKYLIGPMEGSTWNNYRFSDHNKFDNFFLEPYHHEEYSKMFQSFGFLPIAKYNSQRDSELKYHPEKIEQFETILNEQLAVVRNLNMENLEDDLCKIARFSNEAFRNNFLFTPIDEAEFVQKYLKIKQLFKPELVWIVEDASGEIQAISFSIHDYNDPTGKTLILKSLARKKDSSFKGLGTYLVEKTYQSASDHGYEKVIHAFMFSENITIEMSGNFSGREYKSYTLFGLEL